MVVKSGLPLKIKSQTVGMFGYGRFVGTHDGRNGIFADILKSLLSDGFFNRIDFD